jgi:hypothetical protein
MNDVWGNLTHLRPLRPTVVGVGVRKQDQVEPTRVRGRA